MADWLALQDGIHGDPGSNAAKVRIFFDGIKSANTKLPIVLNEIWISNYPEILFTHKMSNNGQNFFFSKELIVN